ncbi:hypothetical protein [Metarhizobium album]|nr:hypothetical protein [Rhizobium album]
MFLTLTVLAALISSMFVASVVSALSELRRESEDMKELTRAHRAF